MMHGRYGFLRSNNNAPAQKPKITWGLLKRIWSYAQPHRRLILWMLLMTLATTGLGPYRENRALVYGVPVRGYSDATY